MFIATQMSMSRAVSVDNFPLTDLSGLCCRYEQSSTDQANTDVQIPIWSNGVLGIGFQLVGVLFVTLNITWQLTFLLIPLGYAYYVYQVLFLSMTAELFPLARRGQ